MEVTLVDERKEVEDRKCSGLEVGDIGSALDVRSIISLFRRNIYYH